MDGAKRYLSRLAVNTSDDGSSAVQLIAPVRFAVSSSVPVAQSASAILYTRSLSGSSRLHFAADKGVATALYGDIGSRHFELVSCASTSQLTLGAYTVTVVSGGANYSYPGVVATSGPGYQGAWISWSNGAAAGSAVALYWNAASTPGDGAGNDGFTMAFRCFLAQASAGSGGRAFFGVMAATPTGGNVEPSTQVNCIGLAKLSTDETQYYLVYGGTTAQVAIPTGLPVLQSNNFRGGTVFDMVITCDPFEANTYRVHVEQVNGSASFDTVLAGGSAVVPQNGTLLRPAVWNNNNALTQALYSGIFHIYTVRPR